MRRALKIMALLLLAANSYGYSYDAVADSVKKKTVTESILAPLNNDAEFCDFAIALNSEELNSVRLYHAKNNILVDGNYGILNTNANIVMKAGKTIVLRPHAFIKRNNRYLARIEDCELVSCRIGMIPRGVSPNQDFHNDEFDLSDNCPIKTLKIFNRYGTNVFEKENYLNEWKGQDKNGDNLPDATYFYYILYENGEQKTGWVYLIFENN